MKRDLSSIQMLRAISLVGTSQAIIYLTTIIRTKFAAVLLGPTGIGLLGLYVATVDLVRTCCQLGIDQSATREIAKDVELRDDDHIGRTCTVVLRATWSVAILGCLVTVAMSPLLSELVLNDRGRFLEFALLGLAVAFGIAATGQVALLQGLRKTRELATSQVLSAVLSSALAILLYTAYGSEGIIPAIVVSAFSNLAITSVFFHRFAPRRKAETWPETFRAFRGLMRLGSAFMYSAVIAAVTDIVIRAHITQTFGSSYNGYYLAAIAIAGIFTTFIIAAMSYDFYPRLASAIGSTEKTNELVNKQMQIGMLLALPGILLTQSFAHPIIYTLYSREFSLATELLPWLLVSGFLQIVVYPLGYIQVAKGLARWIAASQTSRNVTLLAATYALTVATGFLGVGKAAALAMAIHLLVVLGIARHVSGFRFTKTTLHLGLFSITLLAIGHANVAMQIAPLVVGIALILTSLLASLAGIKRRLGS